MFLKFGGKTNIADKAIKTEQSNSSVEREFDIKKLGINITIEKAWDKYIITLNRKSLPKKQLLPRFIMAVSSKTISICCQALQPHSAFWMIWQTNKLVHKWLTVAATRS